MLEGYEPYHKQGYGSLNPLFLVLMEERCTRMLQLNDIAEIFVTISFYQIE